jgi:hypothetical protein
VWLPARLKERLRELSERYGIPQYRLVEDALAVYELVVERVSKLVGSKEGETRVLADVLASILKGSERGEERERALQTQH